MTSFFPDGLTTAAFHRKKRQTGKKKKKKKEGKRKDHFPIQTTSTATGPFSGPARQNQNEKKERVGKGKKGEGRE